MPDNEMELYERQARELELANIEKKSAAQKAREKVEVVLPEAAKDAMDVMMTAMREGEDSVDKIMFEAAKFVLNKVLPTAAPERAVVEEVVEVKQELTVDEVEALLKKKMARDKEKG